MQTNVELELAEQYVQHTRRHCFLTGKAGTGKTTLLKKLVATTTKNHIVVAPTGVAAVNAHGVTIHSMFALPLTCFVPNDDPVDPQIATNRERLLSEHLRLRRQKLDVLQQLDLLIIDEVSMVRADLLDAIDLVLRAVRKNPAPFGDVQVLLMGDVHQLPPVARDREWSVLQRYYRSPFFFDSLVWPRLDAVHIELTTVFRQSDARFLSLLSHIRHRTLTQDDLSVLRERCRPGFTPSEPGFVTLSTHNYQADDINSTRLSSLAGRAHIFRAEIEGEFPESFYPCDAEIQLKVGAQVMFIRNDTEESAYYNGKLAIVQGIQGDEITVSFKDGGSYTLHREIWENTGYHLDEESGKLVQHTLGTFSQYPLRLAWAITIHKSQGLTFDKVIIDAGRAFAPGQVYVALSRCRTLEGIVLTSAITPAALHEDPRIDAFSASHHDSGELARRLSADKAVYTRQSLVKLFSFADLAGPLDEWRELIGAARTLPDRAAAVMLEEHVRTRVAEMDLTAGKFQRQLQRLIEEEGAAPERRAFLCERCIKAIEYFTEQIATQLLTPLQSHLDALKYKSKLKTYVAHVQKVENRCWVKVEHLYGATFTDEPLYRAPRSHTRPVTPVAAKADEGGTFRDTLTLHREGKEVSEIAMLRGLTVATVKKHLERWIKAGDVDVYQVLPKETVDTVLACLKQHQGADLKRIYSALGGKIDYNDIRMVLVHVRRAREDAARQA
jgi:hypothetical protein